MRLLNRFWGVDIEGTITLCNEAFRRLTGYSSSEITGRNAHDAVGVELVPFPIVLDLGFKLASAIARGLRLGVSGFLDEDNYLGHLGWGDDSGDDVNSVQAEKLLVEASMGRTPHEY